MILSFIDFNTQEKFSTFFHVTNFRIKLRDISTCVASFLQSELTNQKTWRAKVYEIKFVFLPGSEFLLKQQNGSSMQNAIVAGDIQHPCNIEFWNQETELGEFIEFYNIPADKKKVFLYFTFHV